MNIIKHIIKKEFLQFKRDEKMRAIAFAAPVVQLILLGYAATMDIKDVDIVVSDMDKTAISREVVSQVTNSGYFKVKYYVDTQNEVTKYINENKATIAIVIPKDFGSKVLASETAPLQVIVDGSDGTAANISLGYVSQIIGRYSQNIMTEVLNKTGNLGFRPANVNAETRVWYNPELKSRNFFVPGVLALLLSIITGILTSLAIVKEKEIGTMEQLMVTPIKPYQLIIGKTVPFTIIGFVGATFAILVALYWFNIPMRGSLLLFFALAVLYILTTLGLGLFVSTVSKTQQQAMLTAMFFVFMPMIFLSGFAFPIENMPEILQYVSYVIPIRYFIVIIRGVFLRGVGFEELWDEALMLAVFGIAIFTLSVIRFNKKLG